MECGCRRRRTPAARPWRTLKLLHGNIHNTPKKARIKDAKRLECREAKCSSHAEKCEEEQKRAETAVKGKAVRRKGVREAGKIPAVHLFLFLNTVL